MVIFTSKDDNLTKGHIKCLEALLYVGAESASRYNLENKSVPAVPVLSRAEQAAMQEFYENMKLLLGSLGYLLLEPLISRSSIKDISGMSDELTFSIKSAEAKGYQTDEGFVLLKGSCITKEIFDSFPQKLKAYRAELTVEHKLKEKGDVLVLTDDIVFSSSSYAAAFVAGTSRSGPQSWKNSEGKLLRELEEALIKG